jgi:restriction system protein
MYEIEIRHVGLHKYRLIKGSDKYVVEQKALAQKLTWDAIWEKKTSADARRKAKEKIVQSKETNRELALERSEEADNAVKEIENALFHTLNLDDKIDWDTLLDRRPFSKGKPAKPNLKEIPYEPKSTDVNFQVKNKWYYFFLGFLKHKAIEKSKQNFSATHKDWECRAGKIKSENNGILTSYQLAVSEWEKNKLKYETELNENNNKILEKKKLYFDLDPVSIVEYNDMVLSNSKYPDNFPQEWDIDYQPETKTTVVDYFLPTIEDMPNIKEVKYVASKNELIPTKLAESVITKMYDKLLYQISLRTIHELYEADQVGALQSIVFNGWIKTIDKSTGKSITVCILSIQATKEEFEKIDLAHVDPKTCFKALKGVGSSKLHGLSPVAPILQLNKEDKRFVSSYSVIGDIDNSSNLAAMDWEDFENLIREIFEKEFSSGGGEVKITQASRDGGVDAVAFDPDPIRGGKIVIQAKRYTNTVGVSAVRDLYGTVMNEGATKGILVTTADYGPDAYSFAKGKPLTLLSGANLLHLLAKHGHKANIDLKAAKQILAEKKNDSGVVMSEHSAEVGPF